MTEIKNKHNCPTDIWDKLSDDGKIIYNEIRNVSAGNILPTKKIDEKDFEIIRHNYACIAAFKIQLHQKFIAKGILS
jgi:hypothetical protein